MGNHGSKSLLIKKKSVKEQRVDGSSIYIFKHKIVRCTLIAGKSGSKVKHSRKIYKINLTKYI
jgi:hypothetical protein